MRLPSSVVGGPLSSFLPMPPRALILHASGTNRDHEAAQALRLAGVLPEIVPLVALRQGAHRWSDFQILVIPGGFSYGDALGAGKLMALDLQAYFAGEANAFVNSGKPVLGICNGFQALVKAGVLPGGSANRATLTFNSSGRFECRWVTLQRASDHCLWTAGLTEDIYCPVAHGEGRFVLGANETVESLRAAGQVALTYVQPDGSPAAGAYPENPNGSVADIAGVCNAAGNVLGLMPHPEDHVFGYQHPRWSRGEAGRSGLPLFLSAVNHLEAS
jgi:phosphoribosylformylglycinamidine synthase